MKMFGGILLIAGTSIGGGMLALPIATAEAGFLNSSLLFLFCWILMTFTALLTLEVNLCFPKDYNVISTAKATLGRAGLIISWTIYLLFLYSLVSAYIAGGRDVIHGILGSIGINIPLSLCGVLFILVFALIVFPGVKSVEIFNRFIMIVKLSLIFLLVFYIAPHINYDFYSQSNPQYLLPSISIAITSFGFSIIIPSLRGFFDDDVRKLRMAIIIGSLLPLICYIAWNAVILGTIPLDSTNGLHQLKNTPQPISGLLAGISYYTHASNTITLSKIFTSISILTSFVCVSLALFDYLEDGFKASKTGKGKCSIMFATFIPPLLVVTFYPKAFILFLSVAGLFCIVLQALLPSLMAWNCRYIKKFPTTYEVWGKKSTLSITILVSITLIFMVIYEIVKNASL